MELWHHESASVLSHDFRFSTFTDSYFINPSNPCIPATAAMATWNRVISLHMVMAVKGLYGDDACTKYFNGEKSPVRLTSRLFETEFPPCFCPQCCMIPSKRGMVKIRRKCTVEAIINRGHTDPFRLSRAPTRAGFRIGRISIHTSI